MIGSSLLQNYLYSVSWTDWINISICILFLSVVSVFIIRKINFNRYQNSQIYYWINLIIKAGKYPIYTLIALYITYFSLYIVAFFLPKADYTYSFVIMNILPIFLLWTSFLVALWFFWRLSTSIQDILKNEKLYGTNNTINIVLPIINTILHAAILLIAANFIVSKLSLSGDAKYYSEKILQVYLIFTIGWILYNIINGVEKIILRQFNINSTINFSARKVQTQVTILKRVIFIIGFIVILASALFVFDKVKRLGMGLLTTAGIISAVGAFASQQSLGRLVSGLQLAFTQPIRIGDSVIVDEQMGVVEEITISYVVVKLWDLRRLIVPTDNIMSRGFQNLTRSSTQLLGTVFIYIDYMLPIDALREQFLKLVSQSSLWDKNTCTLQVTELKEHALEVRGLISAKNGTDLWLLRCEVREKMLKFIVENYPHCLPKVRQLTLDK